MSPWALLSYLLRYPDAEVAAARPELAAGDGERIRGVLRRLAAMRGHMRKREVLGEQDVAMPAAVGMSVDDCEDMYRLLAIADYDDRYVIPQAHAELGERLMEQQGACGLDFEGGPGNCGAVAPASEAGTEGFMLEGDPDRVDLDLVKMAGARRRKGGGA